MKGLNVIKTDLEDFKDDMLGAANYIFFGCWTHGLFIILQHPDKEWKEFAASLRGIMGIKTGYFTTYRILSGSMFRKMMKILNIKFDKPSLFLKSKNTLISENDKLKIDDFLNR